MKFWKNRNPLFEDGLPAELLVDSSSARKRSGRASFTQLIQCLHTSSFNGESASRSAEVRSPEIRIADPNSFVMSKPFSP